MSKSKHKWLDIVGYRLGQALKTINVPNRYISGLFNMWHGISRSVTLGVRVVAYNDKGEIFLVKHTYVSGWHFPGGGVERGQDIREALLMELEEEGNLSPISDAQVFGIYYNRKFFNHDHVVLYTCDVEQRSERPSDMEIADSGFFALDDLPPDTVKVVHDRLAELRGEKPISATWT